MQAITNEIECVVCGCAEWRELEPNWALCCHCGECFELPKRKKKSRVSKNT